MRLDFPTLDRPTRATTGSPSVGTSPPAATLVTKSAEIGFIGSGVWPGHMPGNINLARTPGFRLRIFECPKGLVRQPLGRLRLVDVAIGCENGPHRLG